MHKTELKIVREIFVSTLKQHIKLPDHLPQRDLVYELYPALSEARGLGYSFYQIAKHLETSGFPILEEHLRTFYQECARENIVQMSNDCIKRLKEESDLLSALRGASEAAAPAVDSSSLANPMKTGTETQDKFNPLPLVMSTLQAPTLPEGVAQYKCKPLRTGFEQAKEKPTVIPAVYQEGILEHPGIPGLHLNRAERMYGSFLEIVDIESGEERIETLLEKSLRIFWRRKGQRTHGSTDGDFTPMNLSIFAPEHR